MTATQKFILLIGFWKQMVDNFDQKRINYSFYQKEIIGKSKKYFDSLKLSIYFISKNCLSLINIKIMIMLLNVMPLKSLKIQFSV